eukprot:gene31253-6400_t
MPGRLARSHASLSQVAWLPHVSPTRRLPHSPTYTDYVTPHSLARVAGSRVEIYGVGFSPNPYMGSNVVYIGPYLCKVVTRLSTDRKISCTTSPDAVAGRYEVTVLVNNGDSVEASNSVRFDFYDRRAPSLAFIHPNAGPPGMDVSLYGYDKDDRIISQCQDSQVNCIRAINMGDNKCKVASSNRDFFQDYPAFPRLLYGNKFQINCTMLDSSDLGDIPGQVAGSSNASVQFRGSYQGSTSTISPYEYSTDAKGIPYMFQLYPIIHSVMPSRGSVAGGTIVTLLGRGFPNMVGVIGDSLSITLAGGSTCEVMSTNYSTIVCKTTPQTDNYTVPTAIKGVYPGARGIEFELYRKNGINVPNLHTLNDTVTVENSNGSRSILTGRWENPDDTYYEHSARTKAFYTAPLTGNYSFYITGKDAATLNGTYMVDGEEVTTTIVSSNGLSSASFFSNSLPYSPTAAMPVSLTSGQAILLEVATNMRSSGDYQVLFQAEGPNLTSVGATATLVQLPTTTSYYRGSVCNFTQPKLPSDLSTLLSISMTATSYEAVTPTGTWRMGSDVLGTHWDFAWDASYDEVYAGIGYQARIDASFAVQRGPYLANIWEISFYYNEKIPVYSWTAVALDSVPAGVVVSARVLGGGGGSYGTLILGMGDDCTTISINLGLDTSDLISKKLSALPTLQGIPPSNVDYKPYNEYIDITFSSSHGNLPDLYVAEFNFTRVKSVIVTTIVNGSSDFFYGPLPTEFTKLAAASPDTILLSVNNVPAGCIHHSACTFTYSKAVTPNITSASPTNLSFISAATLQLNITGMLFSERVVDNEVTVGGTACVVISASTKKIVCSLPSTGPAGQHALTVNVAGVGLASGSVMMTVKTLLIRSFRPSSVSASTSAFVNITGRGFDAIAWHNNRVSIGDVDCMVAYVSRDATELVAYFPGNGGVPVPAASIVVEMDDLGGTMIDSATAATTLVISDSAPSLATLLTPSDGVVSTYGSNFSIKVSGIDPSTLTSVWLVPKANIIDTRRRSLLSTPAFGKEYTTRKECTVISTAAASEINMWTMDCKCGVLPSGSYWLVAEISAGEGPQLSTTTVEARLTISSVSPSSGSIAGGTQLTITGQGFNAQDLSANIVMIRVPVSSTFLNGVVLCDIVSASRTQLQCRTRSHLAADVVPMDPYARNVQPKATAARAVQLVVSNAGLSDVHKLEEWSKEDASRAIISDSDASSCIFGYSAAATPIINTLSTQLGTIGGELIINGSNLADVYNVLIKITGLNITGSLINLSLPYVPAGMYTLALEQASGGMSLDPQLQARIMVQLTVVAVSPSMGSLAGDEAGVRSTEDGLFWREFRKLSGRTSFYAARYTFYMYLAEDGMYNFLMDRGSNEAARLYIDGILRGSAEVYGDLMDASVELASGWHSFTILILNQYYRQFIFTWDGGPSQGKPGQIFPWYSIFSSSCSPGSPCPVSVSVNDIPGSYSCAHTVLELVESGSETLYPNEPANATLEGPSCWFVYSSFRTPNLTMKPQVTGYRSNGSMGELFALSSDATLSVVGTLLAGSSNASKYSILHGGINLTGVQVSDVSTTEVNLTVPAISMASGTWPIRVHVDGFGYAQAPRNFSMSLHYGLRADSVDASDFSLYGGMDFHVYGFGFPALGTIEVDVYSTSPSYYPVYYQKFKLHVLEANTTALKMSIPRFTFSRVVELCEFTFRIGKDFDENYRTVTYIWTTGRRSHTPFPTSVTVPSDIQPTTASQINVSWKVGMVNLTAATVGDLSNVTIELWSTNGARGLLNSSNANVYECSSPTVTASGIVTTSGTEGYIVTTAGTEGYIETLSCSLPSYIPSANYTVWVNHPMVGSAYNASVVVKVPFSMSYAPESEGHATGSTAGGTKLWLHAETTLMLVTPALPPSAANGTATTTMPVITPSLGATPQVNKSMTFTYDEALTPQVASLHPLRGSTAGGTNVTITGIRFASAAAASSIVPFVQIGSPNLQGPEAVSMLFEGIGYASMGMDVAYEYMNMWSSTTTWGGRQPPVEGDLVYVPGGITVMLDISPPPMTALILDGTLVFDPLAEYLHLQGNFILLLGGNLSVGSESEAYTGKATITLLGEPNTLELPN